MRAELFVFLSLLFSPYAQPQDRAAPAPSAAEADRKEPAALEGRVLNALTGEPIRKANLVLSQFAANSVGTGPPQSTAAVSDMEGKFRFETLEPGRYMLSADKTGFVRQQYGARTGQLGPGTTLTLGSGEKLKNLEFKLTPQAVISGKVLDEDGEPLPGVMIQALRHTAYSSRPMGAMGMAANDVGEFRIANLAPGKYIVRAEYRRNMFGAPPQARGTDAEGVEDYVPTFYPGVTESNAAVPIAVTAGQEVSGIAVRLQKARVYRIRGKILGTAVDRYSRVQVTLQPQWRSGAMMSFGGAGGGNVNPDGTFELASVQPGSYNLIVMRFETGRAQTMGRLPVTVSNRNVDGLVIQAGVPIEVAGKVTAEGDEKATIAGNVMLQPVEGMGFGISPARVQPDGTFKMEGVSRDKYLVSIIGLPEGMYVKRVKAGGSDVLENGLDLSQAESAPPLEIVISSKGATIEGIVRREDKPWQGASITLLPEPFRPDRARWIQRAAGSDQNGRFTLKGIAPGEYRIYAWEEFVPVFDLEPEQLKTYEAYAVKVKVNEEARERVELKLARPQEQ